MITTVIQKSLLIREGEGREEEREEEKKKKKKLIKFEKKTPDSHNLST